MAVVLRKAAQSKRLIFSTCLMERVDVKVFKLLEAESLYDYVVIVMLFGLLINMHLSFFICRYRRC